MTSPGKQLEGGHSYGKLAKFSRQAFQWFLKKGSIYQRVMGGRKTMPGAGAALPEGLGWSQVSGLEAEGAGRVRGAAAIGIVWGRATPALPAGALGLGTRWRQPRVATSIAATDRGFRGQRGPSATLEPSLRHLSRSRGGSKKGWKPLLSAPRLGRSTGRAEGEGAGEEAARKR